MHVPVHSTSTSIPPGGTNEIFLTRRAPSSPTPADSSPPSPKWVARRPFDENAGKKPSPTTTSKYPKNMPPWFKDYDGDSDGQVAMAEWRDKKDVLSEFKKYDLNDDGYITLEELVHSG
jgi:hypothetical protein